MDKLSTLLLLMQKHQAISIKYSVDLVFIALPIFLMAHLLRTKRETEITVSGNDSVVERFKLGSIRLVHDIMDRQL